MRIQSLLTLVATATAVTAQGSDAPEVTNNPIGAQYIAELKPTAKSNLSGSVKISTAPNGVGVQVEVAVAGLPATGGPFMYHIHEKPVPTDGNCTGTGAHLDPYKRGEVPICDATKKESCQTGDLSGKYGNITTQDFTATYHDAYLATLPGDPSYFGNRSVVFHLSNKTRIACANFTELSPGAVSSSTVSIGTSLGTGLPTASGSYNSTPTTTVTVDGTPSATPIAPSTPLTPSTQPNSGATKLAMSAGAVLAFAAALML